MRTIFEESRAGTRTLVLVMFGAMAVMMVEAVRASATVLLTGQTPLLLGIADTEPLDPTWAKFLVLPTGVLGAVFFLIMFVRNYRTGLVFRVTADDTWVYQHHNGSRRPLRRFPKSEIVGVRRKSETVVVGRGAAQSSDVIYLDWKRPGAERAKRIRLLSGRSGELADAFERLREELNRRDF